MMIGNIVRLYYIQTVCIYIYMYVLYIYITLYMYIITYVVMLYKTTVLPLFLSGKRNVSIHYHITVYPVYL